MSATIVVCRPGDLTVEVVERIAYARERFCLHESLLAVVATSSARTLSALASAGRIYGVNTGMGYLAAADVSEGERAEHQRSLLLGRAVGSGPFLPPPEARGLLLTRLVNFLSGHAGVTPDLCSFIVDRLNDDFVPAVPRRGIGCAGEVIPLSHAFQTFLGVGQVITSEGRLQDARTALAERGVAPYEPGVKEGVALLAGAPGVTALGIARHRGARILFGQLLIGAACSVEALRAPLDPYDEAVGRLAEDSELSQVLGRLGEVLRGSSEDRQQGQAPVSFRVIPQVLTHLGRTIGRFGEDVRRALRAVTDSPAYLEGRFLTNGGFHEIEVAAGMDSLALALIRAVELAAQRIHRLLDHRFSRLPDQLTPRPVGCGLVVVQKRAVGVVNELRRLGAPACLGLADTSLGQEDAMTFGFEAAEKLRRVEELVREILACELLVARQAWALRGGQPAAGLTAVAASIAELVDPVDEDRPLAEDLSRLVGLLERNELT